MENKKSTKSDLAGGYELLHYYYYYYYWEEFNLMTLMVEIRVNYFCFRIFS